MSGDCNKVEGDWTSSEKKSLTIETDLVISPSLCLCPEYFGFRFLAKKIHLHKDYTPQKITEKIINPMIKQIKGTKANDDDDEEFRIVLTQLPSVSL